MKMAKREESSKTMDMISELPKDILRRILYFLSQTDAIRTSVLSKSWRYLWCTRPNLDFSYKTRFKGDEREFLHVVDKTLQQYCDQRVRLEEFRLHIDLSPDHDHGSVSFLQKWNPLLTSMGVKEFRLSSYGGHSGARVDLPSVVFRSESLTHLELEDFYLDQESIGGMLLCKHLKSLSLEEEVRIDDNTLQTIIASCPLIETLDVRRRCRRGLTTIKMNHLHHLKKLILSEVRNDKADKAEELCSIEIYPPSLETIDVYYGNILFHKGANFLNLNVFHLEGMGSSLDHFSSCKFPNLTWLILYDCDGLKEIELFIDAPNILSFEYGGRFVPSISFATTSNEWKSEIWVRELEGSLCFVKLYELLKSLSQSEISLEIGHDGSIQENIMLQDNGYTKPVVVKSLGLRCPSSSFPSVLNAAFCICRPRKIVNLSSGTTTEEFVRMMGKILMERESGKKDELTQVLFRDLEEASLEIKESKETVMRDDDEGWHPAPLSEFIFIVNYKGCVGRFALKWRETL